MPARTDTVQATVTHNGASRGEGVSRSRDAAVSTPPASVSAGAVEYRPATGSAAHRILTFFAVNTDEELTTVDIAIKFDAAPKAVRILLARAIEAGLLHVDRVDAVKRGSPMLIYRAGPKLAAWWRCVA